MNGLNVAEVNRAPAMAGGYIFNSPEFQSLKTGNLRYFGLFKHDQVLARLCFTIDKDQAVSGHQATFGSFDSESELSAELAKFFLKEVGILLQAGGIKEVIIKHWPECYIGADAMQEIFAELGYGLLSSEINQHLVVQEKAFNLVIRKNERKKLNQCLNKGYTFKILSRDDLARVYQLVTKTRLRRGYPVSMAYEQLYKNIESLPDQFLLFGLFDKDTGHHSGGQSLNRYCRENGVNPFSLHIAWCKQTPWCNRCAEINVFDLFLDNWKDKASTNLLNKKRPPKCPDHNTSIA